MSRFVYFLLILFATPSIASEPTPLFKTITLPSNPLSNCERVLRHGIPAQTLYPQMGASLFEIFPYSVASRDARIYDAALSRMIAAPFTQIIDANLAKIPRDDSLETRLKAWASEAIERKVFSYRWKNIDFMDDTNSEQSESNGSPLTLMPREIQLDILERLDSKWRLKSDKEHFVEDVWHLYTLAYKTPFTLSHIPTEREYFPVSNDVQTDLVSYSGSLHSAQRLIEELGFHFNSVESYDQKWTVGLSPEYKNRRIFYEFLKAKFGDRTSIDPQEYISVLSQYIEIYILD